MSHALDTTRMSLTDGAARMTPPLDDPERPGKPRERRTAKAVRLDGAEPMAPAGPGWRFLDRALAVVFCLGLGWFGLKIYEADLRWGVVETMVEKGGPDALGAACAAILPEIEQQDRWKAATMCEAWIKRIPVAELAEAKGETE